MIRHFGALATALLVGLVIWMGCDLALRGASGFSFQYLLAPPTDLGRSGGIGPMLISTAVIVSLATVCASLLSLPCAIAYTELLGPSQWRWFRRFVHATLDLGVGVPRIVWGLFGGVLFGGVLGFGFSLFTGIMTLTCLLAPILTTGFIAGLQAVSPALREECDILGVSRWTAVWRQILPAARPALTASVALAVGRGCGDAAALLFTAGISTHIPQSFFDPAATLAVHVFHLLATVPGGQQAAYTAAAVLFFLTFIIQFGITWTNRYESRTP